jgi:hypothetical protein
VSADQRVAPGSLDTSHQLVLKVQELKMKGAHGVLPEGLKALVFQQPKGPGKNGLLLYICIMLCISFECY